MSRPATRSVPPSMLDPDGARPLHGRFILRTARRLARPHLVVGQDGHVLHRQRLLPAEPHRPFRLRADRVDRVDPHGGTVRITAV
ncbi:hypothetical protein [Streptomyces sp. NPDC051286]|uniref:hypothetical protein n=1 Tax=Streptomyces sp. NPDC051286 TaxID=3365647 RepID=UPI0037AAC49C